MYDIDKCLQKALKAQEAFQQLKRTDSMGAVADIINALDEETAKLVLRMFVYEN